MTRQDGNRLPPAPRVPVPARLLPARAVPAPRRQPLLTDMTLDVKATSLVPTLPPAGTSGESLESLPPRSQPGAAGRARDQPLRLGQEPLTTAGCPARPVEDITSALVATELVVAARSRTGVSALSRSGGSTPPSAGPGRFGPRPHGADRLPGSCRRRPWSTREASGTRSPSRDRTGVFALRGQCPCRWTMGPKGGAGSSVSCHLASTRGRATCPLGDSCAPVHRAPAAAHRFAAGRFATLLLSFDVGPGDPGAVGRAS
jgi:hypothetical protein